MQIRGGERASGPCDSEDLNSSNRARTKPPPKPCLVRIQRFGNDQAYVLSAPTWWVINNWIFYQKIACLVYMMIITSSNLIFNKVFISIYDVDTCVYR